MRKIVIFGNSGSGKSTLAKKLQLKHNLQHLDLDTLAWLATTPPTRRPITESNEDILNFIDRHESWVIEGCYADIIELLLPYTNELIFMNLPITLCIENAKSRPWEPHKYDSKQVQDDNLPMLIDWISQYDERDDVFSQQAHLSLFHAYTGTKYMITSNENTY